MQAYAIRDLKTGKFYAGKGRNRWADYPRKFYKTPGQASATIKLASALPGRNGVEIVCFEFVERGAQGAA